MSYQTSDTYSQDDLSQSVVQVLTVHCVPNLMRPWETGHDTESSSSAFVVDRERRLLMTTAGAVGVSRGRLRGGVC